MALIDFLSREASKAECLLIEAAGTDNDMRAFFESTISPIVQKIKAGVIRPPNEMLSEYWHYFSPEGPWKIWENFPDLVLSISTLVNLSGLSDDDEFMRYCNRHRLTG